MAAKGTDDERPETGEPDTSRGREGGGTGAPGAGEGGERGAERKERVLHARVSPDLDEELRKRARGLGISVSNLVRNVLLNTFGLVEDIVLDGASVARSATTGDAGADDRRAGRGSTPARPAEPGAASHGSASQVLGWQELVLAVNAVCTDCNAILPKGSRGAIALIQGSGPRSFLCPSCLAARSSTPG